MKDFFGEAPNTIFFFKEDYIHWYWNDNDLTRIREEFFMKLKKNNNFLEELKTKWKAKIHRFDGIMKKVDQTDLSRLTNEELASLYDDFYKKYTDEYKDFMSLGDAVSMHAEHYLVPIFQEILGKNFVTDFPKLVATKYLSFVEEENLERAKFLVALKNKKEIDRPALQKHADKFFYIQNNYARGVRLTADDFEPMIREDFKKNVKPAKDMREKHLKEKQKLIKKFKISGWNKTLLYVMDEFFMIQDTRKKYVLISNYYQLRFLHEAERRTGIPFKPLCYSVYPEYRQILEGKIDIKILKERNKLSAIVHTGNTYEILTGLIAEKAFSFFQNSSDDRQELKGMIACPGKVTGRVKKILKIHDMVNMEKGDILVSSMTRPEMVPAMKLAGAIITDEGGVTSHAAIVSREMGIPCIIGTKRASRVLQNGDLVEVDANQGVVRILTKDGDTHLQKKNFKERWHKLLAREGVDITTISQLDVVFYELIRKATNNLDELFFTYLEGKNFTHYIGVPSIEVGRFAYRKYFNTAAQIKTYYREGTRLRNSIIKEAGEFSLRLSKKVTDKTLIEAFHNFRKSFKQISNIYSIISWLGIEAWQADFEDTLNGIISRNHLEKQTEKILSSVYKPWKKTALIEIQEKLSKGMKPQKIVTQYQFLRSWSVVWYRPITVEWVRSLADNKEKKETQTFSSGQLLELLKPTNQEKKLIHLAPFIVFFKDWRDDIRRHHAFEWSFIFDVIAKKISISRDEVGYLTLDEIEAALKNSRKIDLKIIQNRKQRCVVTIADKGLRMRVLEENIPDKYQTIMNDVEHREQKKIVHGKTAHTGKVRGMVKIIRSYHDIKRIQKGDILVANTTHPNYLPAMQKAAAFVTNEGGLISHAAIVAREMKKPCIVGCGDATKILTEGDFVEVDAGNGTIKILKP